MWHSQSSDQVDQEAEVVLGACPPRGNPSVCVCVLFLQCPGREGSAAWNAAKGFNVFIEIVGHRQTATMESIGEVQIF